MSEQLLITLRKWNADKNERQKLQHTYLVLTVAIVLTAGVASLFDGRLGQGIVQLALIALGAFAVNAVVWSLLQSWVLLKLSAPDTKLTAKPKIIK